ncbi:hypothetical protein [Aeromicrobium sp. Root495]|uniref:hypothetical protein n=1 Tax=Aeromicrobium sp. Root495 TaxID=1736550 RepID=UPI0012E81661|nr:hypothetical protein [Aeromicrobium sp. Root495]
MFADSNDLGQDGGWQGQWEESRDPALMTEAVGSVVIQCKFSVNGSGTLTMSQLQDELESMPGAFR